MRNDQKPAGNGKPAAADKSTTSADSGKISAPSISLPKGGGAIRGIGEKFAANPVTGTGSMTVPIATSPGRSGFGPQLSLSYDSGAGNGPFGFGWSLSVPAITRKTDKGLPKYQDADDSDVFILSGAEDLVPLLVEENGKWERKTFDSPSSEPGYTIERYRPRIEGLFARIERWTNKQNGDVHWRSITKDNITTFYGKTAESCIAVPADPTRVFSWLICESHDDKGNAIFYQYKEDNTDGVDLSFAHEKNRTAATRSANRYLKRVKYGNRTPHQRGEDLSQRTDWLFEVVFDYGEHYAENDQGRPTFVAIADNQRQWASRQDPFSSYRAGFEVRTYRLCHRVLMFHHFSELGTPDYLVRATEFTYKQSPIASFITKATQSGYVRQPDETYLKKSLPPLEFKYSEATINEEIREVGSKSLENLPYGLDGARYQWVDLDGEGLSGILTEQADGWFYKRNLSPINTRPENGREMVTAGFGPVELVAEKPSLAALNGGGQQFLDLAGDGQLDLVELQGPTPGFYERTHDERWEAFEPFDSLPVLDWGNPNLKFVDLTGDGHADILISEDHALCWHPSLAEEGFDEAERVQQSWDEEKGPKLIFADGTQSIYLADISGDGLTDLVRIRNGEVCYWPNLGYGRFGAKVTMDDAPWFDAPDLFDQRRIRLADIDGSGVTDIIYLGCDGVHLYFNQSGNSWSAARVLSAFPRIDNLAAIQVTDLLGNGTACLVWSSPLPGDARQPMRYLDLMGGQKPHLLISSKNNLGAETKVTYASSTKFYLQDKREGRPWITKLPFPVHVVEAVETYDHLSRNLFVTRYAYHHGNFDGFEREFRGFGMVEQSDTKEFAALNASGTLSGATNIDAASHVPPVLTKTWFHTGAYLEDGKISKHFEAEYYRESDLSEGVMGLTEAQLQAMLLDDTTLPEALSAEEEREACRSLKGSILRQEVYALDDTAEADRPYSVSERNYTIKSLQPRAENRHAVFFSHPRETIDFHYARKLFDINGSKVADPRVSHQMNLEVDELGNVLKAVAIGYGRRYDDPDPLLTLDDRNKQKRTLSTYTENAYTDAINTDNDYRTPLLCETRAYELLKLAPQANTPGVTNLFRFDEMIKLIQSASVELPYEQWNVEPTTSARRLIEHVRQLYYRNDLATQLSLGKMGSLGLPYETYKLAFTPELLNLYSGKIAANDLKLALNDEGRYVDLDNNGRWWIPSGRQIFDPTKFYLPVKFIDPFIATLNLAYEITYDVYALLMIETKDPRQNVVKAENDYRVLQPQLITDPNENRDAVAFDALGMVAGTAVRGKATESKGDSLAGFKTDLLQNEIDAFFADPKGVLAETLLGTATTRIIYDLERFTSSGQPAFAATLARETHVNDPLPPAGLKIQISFSFSDGFGREIQKKIQAEPGPVNGVQTDPRWVGSGWTIFNNKGKPVKQFEPFFSKTHDFEFGKQVGVSSTLFYDPVERVVATLHPNHTYEKVVFDPWRQETWDVNDTLHPKQRYDPRTPGVLPDHTFNPVNDPDVGAYFKRLSADDYLPTWYDLRMDSTKAMQKWPDVDLVTGIPIPENPAIRVAEKKAAEKAAKHAVTPTIAQFDTLGRTFLTIADNGLADDGTLQKYETRVELDIEGNQRVVTDALGREVMTYDYDMLSNKIHQNSMDAGKRWMLNNVAGKPIRAWDSRDHEIITTYDELLRPTQLFKKEGTKPEVLAERTVYGEAQGSTHNLRGKVYQQFDGAGKVTNEAYDFKGNLLRSTRQLRSKYSDQVNWNNAPGLEDEIFVSSTTYDALNRPILLITPHTDKIPASRIHPIFNEANLLNAVKANLRGANTETDFVTNIDYNAKGQREKIEYGNGAQTIYDYDPLTFRLTNLKTTRATSSQLQDLFYTYDPAGNITSIRDEAQQKIYFNNQVVTPNAEYVYDAIYRLIRAEGREHIGQASNNQPQHRADLKPEYDFNDITRRNLAHPHDGQKMQNYTQVYEYDEVGNILKMIHQAASGGYTRRYTYDEPSLIESGKENNHLTSTSLPGDLATGSLPRRYEYDLHGNMTKMPHLREMIWDFEDQLQQVDLNGGGKAYYVYDDAGQRVRKVHELNGSTVEERIYLSGFEIYRKRNASGLVLERETLHIMDDKKRIALVETKTNDAEQPATRYQLDNHLGSACLELNENGAVISYEEYHPYGTTSYQAGRNAAEVSLKRYRYTGKERDEKTGLYYNIARYFAPWLGRWMSCDPEGFVDGANVYTYVRDNPTRYVDSVGKRAVETEFGTYEVTTTGGPPASNNLTEQELKRLGEAWRNIHFGFGAHIIGRPSDLAAFDTMLREGLTSSRIFRETFTRIGHEYDPGKTIILSVGKNQPRVLVDTFATDQVDIADLAALPSIPDTHARRTFTRSEAILHFLVEREHAKLHPELVHNRQRDYAAQHPEKSPREILEELPPPQESHDEGLRAQTQYRAERGLIGVGQVGTVSEMSTILRNFFKISFLDRPSEFIFLENKSDIAPEFVWPRIEDFHRYTPNEQKLLDRLPREPLETIPIREPNLLPGW